MSLARTISYAFLSGYVAIDQMLLSALQRVVPRPQNPRKRPYQVREVMFPGGDDGITLAGELTLPSKGGPFPAVVLISGAWPGDRNMSVDRHKPFLVLSDHLTRHGHAVLRFDDRGVGASADNAPATTMSEIFADAAAALNWLRALPDVDAGRAGYISFSEGGCIASLAAQSERPDFMVLLSCPARPLADVARRQQADSDRAFGMTEAEVEEEDRRMARFLDILRHVRSPDEARAPIREHMQEGRATEFQIRQALDGWANCWGLWSVEFDPRPVLADYGGPVLALFGEKDVQVIASENAPVMRAALTHTASRVMVLPHLNHMLRPAKTGLPEEYWEIRKTFDEGAMEVIVDWLDRIVRAD